MSSGDGARHLRSPRPSSGSRRSRGFWLTVAVILFASGTAVTALASSQVAHNDAHHSQEEFDSSAAEVASALELAVQREEDLGIGAQAFLAANPEPSNRAFLEWTESIQAFERNHAIESLGFATIVPRAELDSYAARAVEDPAGPLGPDGTFEVEPPGDRPFYCFVVSATSRFDIDLPAGFDVCESPLGPPLLEARDTARRTTLAFDFGEEPSLLLQRPIYRGPTPTSVEARREAFVGWVATSADPQVLLARALGNRRELGAELRYDGTTEAVFRAGAHGDANASETFRLDEGMEFEVVGQVDSAAIGTNANALALLVAGILASTLFASFVYLIATGRARAMQLVRQKTRTLEHLALHDALTDLPNRTLIVDRLEQLVARRHRHGDEGAVLFVDLDGFKAVNDTIGHDAGDQLLRAAAQRLRSTLRSVDTIGRIGGDEFVVLVDGGEPGAEPETVAQRLLQAMQQPFELDRAPEPVTVTASIGIARIDGQSAEELLRDADLALYRAKASGRDCYEFFRPEMETTVRRRFELERELRYALERGELGLEYEPIYSLESLEVVGVEALLRWDHPTLGAVAPRDFLPLLDTSGIATEVGQWMLVDACNHAAAWRTSRRDLVLSVNALARQFERKLIADQVRTALAVSGLDPRALGIEVTESILMDGDEPEVVADLLGELKDLGVHVTIDDFGSGYSSLSRLQHLPFDALKIDQTFIDAIDHSPVAAALVQTLVQLGRELGFHTMAQGLEHTPQLDHLRIHAVDHVQGTLLGEPVDAGTFTERLPEDTPSPNRS